MECLTSWRKNRALQSFIMITNLDNKARQCPVSPLLSLQTCLQSYVTQNVIKTHMQPKFSSTGQLKVFENPTSIAGCFKALTDKLQPSFPALFFAQSYLYCFLQPTRIDFLRMNMPCVSWPLILFPLGREILGKKNDEATLKSQ